MSSLRVYICVCVDWPFSGGNRSSACGDLIGRRGGCDARRRMGVMSREEGWEG